MIIADTDILSALAKVGRMPLLLSLFNTTDLYITPAVFSEIEHSFDLGRQYAMDLFAMLSAGQLRIVYLTPDEVAFRDTLPVTLGSGERESIAERSGQCDDHKSSLRESHPRQWVDDSSPAYTGSAPGIPVSTLSLPSRREGREITKTRGGRAALFVGWA